ncbi:hypothetical protein [Granulicella sp. L60]|uniref:hypothetical protein n=1 Tax=Granulicella sp. L60 TaxID=1641866 RepID=UPI00131A6E02|nr:hypothetical protein [Granulicella sp. L60]
MRQSVLFLIAVTVFAGTMRATCAESTDSVRAQSISGSTTSPELSVDGPIIEVVSKRSLGSPQGTHLLVSANMQTMDVSVGPYLAPDVRTKISKASQIHVTGVMRSINGKTYLVAREIVLNGQTFVIRNQSGFLVHGSSSNGQPGSRREHTEQVGGAN